ncbi:type IV pilus twitching motility protein PilT [Succiniclasticum ruminis]|uniref:Twitching motility protein PilT n=1 Tax=Succiniclasticum ruminis DSM 9236 TaxID=1123323 RepID=A0A1I2DFG0_9FIRM|nr:type IV pilus twitching motility protein PilT [Succiniclasticum ruminis]SFE79332.1 twitching motility protein PilT [Succiniclasticum ruminis DSM 9236]
MNCRIDEILLKAAEMNASDLHISEGGSVIVRIAGTLTKPGSVLSDVFSLFEPVLPGKQRVALKQYGECDFAYALPSGQRFRINLYRSMEGLDAAVRIIPNSIPTCSGLGLPEALRKLSELKSGLVLLTGVTGSGKSTTLAAIVNEINRHRAVHILTLEDPVEYRFASDRSLIHQREIGSDTVDFASGLRAALREDPDVIVVGELRDLETISIVVTAAETGHLVLSTLHTRSAVETVDRIIDVFPEQQQRQIRVQLAGCLQAVVSQQLLPDKRGGRTAAFEIMIVTPALRNLIREGKTQQMGSYLQTGGQYGMQTMEAALEELKRRGRV